MMQISKLFVYTENKEIKNTRFKKSIPSLKSKNSCNKIEIPRLSMFLRERKLCTKYKKGFLSVSTTNDSMSFKKNIQLCT